MYKNQIAVTRIELLNPEPINWVRKRLSLRTPECPIVWNPHERVMPSFCLKNTNVWV